MELQFADWAIIAGFFVVALGIGVVVTRQASKSKTAFFLSGRHMPWWLLGMSMVATTFATDTPNLVTNLVRDNGVAGNWVWWAFLFTGMLTVFVYAKLWRRSGLVTDIEFYELRYSGRSAAFLRGLRGVYMGLVFNCLIIGIVTLALTKISGPLLGLDPLPTVLIAAGVTVVFSALGGFQGVLLTDCLLFVVAMAGAIAAAVYCVNLPEVGGLSGLLSHPEVQAKTAILPSFDLSSQANVELLITIFLMPLAVQWWAMYYPGAEPGGGTYIAQRMLAAKNEKHAIGAKLFFSIAHYAVRPWPWILVALCSLVIYPEVSDMQQAFPDVSQNIIKQDLAYPAMLTFLPTGLMGLVLASLFAAYMSTVSTQLNLGSSYLVNDVYQRFFRPQASQRELVFAGRATTVLQMIIGGAIGLWLSSAVEGFNMLLQIGAGTGLVFLLRWFWWRVNAWSEIAAMLTALACTLLFKLAVFEDIRPVLYVDVKGEAAEWPYLLLTVGITTAVWLTVTFLTRPTHRDTLRSFYRKIRPGGPGWRKVVAEASADGETIEPQPGQWSVPLGLLCTLVGTIMVYAALFATGYFIYGRTVAAWGLSAVTVASAVVLVIAWPKISR
jgi:Na+/proline symporter